MHLSEEALGEREWLAVAEKADWIFREIAEIGNWKQEAPILQYYDLQVPVVVSVDALQNGVGAVLL